MKKQYLVVLLVSILLQSCQTVDDGNSLTMAKKPSLEQAALYNTELGLAYLNRGDRSRAQHKLGLALKQSPKSTRANLAMAYLMEQNGDGETANAFYIKAIQTAPKQGEPLNNYGVFLCKKGKYSRAVHYFLQAVKDKYYEHIAGSYENAGLCALAIPDLSHSANYFASALTYDPTRTQSLYELVRIELVQGQVQKASVYLQQYDELLKNNPLILALAIKTAKLAGDNKLESVYNNRLALCERRTK